MQQRYVLAFYSREGILVLPSAAKPVNDPVSPACIKKGDSY